MSVALADRSSRQDVFTGDELLSDTWQIKEIDGVYYEIDCKDVKKGGENIGAYLCPGLM